MANVITGTDNADYLVGSPADDTLLGGEGNDTISAEDGNDFIVTEGVASIRAGAGQDTIRAQGSIWTGAGADVVQLIGDSELDFGDDPSTRDEVHTDASFALQMHWRAGSLGDVWREPGQQAAVGPVTLKDERNDELFLVQHAPQPGDAGSQLPTVGIVSGATGEARIQITGAADFIQTNPLPYSGVPVNVATNGYPQPAPIADRSSKLMPVVTAGTLVLKAPVISDFNNIEATGDAGVVLLGGTYTDRLVGANGNDLLIGGAGDDTLSGGLGADTYLVGRNRGTDTIDADAQDTLLLAGHRTTDIVVRPWDQWADTVELWLPGEVFFNMDVNVRALQYSDGRIILRNASQLTGLTIRSEVEGDAVLTWSEVAARAGVGALSDRGNPEPERIDGSAGNDTLYGGPGNDTLRGKDGDDVLYAGDDNDALDGGNGNDLVVGGAGRDRIVSDAGDDTLEGGAGSDEYDIFFFQPDRRIVLVPDALDRVRVPVDLDLVVAQADQKGVSLSFNDGGNTGEVVIADITGLEGLVFENGFTGATRTLAEIMAAQGLTLEGTEGADVLTGGVRHDRLTGLGGDDQLQGGAGDDTLVGGLGQDTLAGEDGNDVLDGSAGDDLLSGGAGNDTLSANFGNDVLDSGEGVNLLTVGSGEAPSAQRLTTIRANAQDTLVIANGLKLADAALNTYNGQTQALTIGVLDGVTGQAAGRVQIDHADQLGALTILGDAGARQALAALLAQASQTQGGSAGADTLNGFVGQDLILGDAGNDVINGLGGHDTLSGGAGADAIDGGAGNDQLSGDAGNDTLQGGLGNDTLIGQKGNDTYLFGRGQGQDTIVDKDSTWFNSDTLKIANAESDQLWFTRSGNNLNIAIIGTTDKVTIQDWYTSSANRVEKITALGDNKTLNLSRLNGLVSAMAGFTSQAMAGTELPAGTSNSLSKLITSSWTPA
jgi:trimeric autotransporter adhesin